MMELAEAMQKYDLTNTTLMHIHSLGDDPGYKIPQPTLKALQKRMLVDEGGHMMPECVDVYEADGGAVLEVHYLELGSPISVIRFDKRTDGRIKLMLKKGSRLMIVFQEVIGKVTYYSCFGGEQIGIVLVAKNSNHKFGSYKHPENHKMQVQYSGA